jgi:hypothetical protein
VQATIDGSHEYAACRARLDKAYSIAANDASAREQTNAKDGIPEETINAGRSGSRRQGENDAARFPAQAAASPKGHPPSVECPSGREAVTRLARRAYRKHAALCPLHDIGSFGFHCPQWLNCEGDKVTILGESGTNDRII